MGEDVFHSHPFIFLDFPLKIYDLSKFLIILSPIKNYC